MVDFTGVVVPADERDGVVRRYRFRAEHQPVDALLTEAAETVWRQAHPDADEAALDEWAVAVARERLDRRLREEPENVGELLIDSGLTNPDEPGRYGEGGQPHR
jgi:hypothetical protein